MAKIIYQNECEIEEDDPTKSILDISLENNIPHIHACGGNARCSTCRVIVTEGIENLSPRNDAEQKLALQKGFSENIRLACQTCVTGDISLRRLVLDDRDISLALNDQSTTGREANIAVLFCDIRDFTPFSEKNFPYDIVHALNRFFLTSGDAIIKHNGKIDKYMGDGMMALFGLDNDSPSRTCLDAVSAAKEIVALLPEFNTYLKTALGAKFEVGIGIDFGEVILGEIGHPDHKSFSAIGNTVNTASRIETATKSITGSILVSQSVYDNLPTEMETTKIDNVTLKGRQGTHSLYEIEN